jgi:hypothetical protein
MPAAHVNQDSCEARIAQHMEGREADARKLLAAANGDQVCENCGQVIWRNGTDTEWVADGVCTAPAHEPDEDYTEDSLYEYGLDISRKVVLTYLLSTGGPGDWLEIVCDEEQVSYDGYSVPERTFTTRLNIERVVYHFNDWFDHAERPVYEGSALWSLAEWVVEGQS